jgi:hypothetical protein
MRSYHINSRFGGRARWMAPTYKLVDTPQLATVFVYPGGADINP